jgi:membrane-bound ClpP family serine protease
MSWTVIALLIFIGIIFIVLEVLVLPGTTVAGILGFILIALGVWQTYRIHGATAGHVTLAISLVAGIGLLILSLRSKTWNRMMLKTEITGKMNVIENDAVKAGDTGITISRLAPAGKVLVNDEYFEAHTQGDFIDQQKEIIVMKVEANKLIVKLKES